MKYFEVGYDVGNGIFSVNVIWANTGNEELEAAAETAQRHAERYGYTVAYIKEISKQEAQARANRGMYIGHIDEEAERAHDPSFRDC